MAICYHFMLLNPRYGHMSKNSMGHAEDGVRKKGNPSGSVAKMVC